MQTSTLDVVVGVIRNQRERFLCGQRQGQDRYSGQWEFPGGKIEQGESELEALARELHEELGIHLEKAVFLLQTEYQYPDRFVRLSVYLVESYTGQCYGKEGQNIAWNSIAEIRQMNFLVGNKVLLEYLEENLNATH